MSDIPSISDHCKTEWKLCFETLQIVRKLERWIEPKVNVFLLQGACWDHPASNEVFGVYTSRQKAEEAYKKLRGIDIEGNPHGERIEEMIVDSEPFETGISS